MKFIFDFVAITLFLILTINNLCYGKLRSLPNVPVKKALNAKFKILFVRTNINILILYNGICNA